DVPDLAPLDPGREVVGFTLPVEAQDTRDHRERGGRDEPLPERLERRAGPRETSPEPLHHSYRPASIGSSSHALRAGSYPKTWPTPVENRAARTMPPGDSCIGHWSVRPTRTEATMPRKTPRTPPARLSITDSPRNCSWIAASVAPTAMRTPISRVRS